MGFVDATNLGIGNFQQIASGERSKVQRLGDTGRRGGEGGGIWRLEVGIGERKLDQLVRKGWCVPIFKQPSQLPPFWPTFKISWRTNFSFCISSSSSNIFKTNYFGWSALHHNNLSMDFDVIITKEACQYFHIFCSLTRYLLPYRFSIGLFCNFALQLPFYGINCIKYMQTRHFFTFDTIAENGISGQYCPAAALASFWNSTTQLAQQTTKQLSLCFKKNMTHDFRGKLNPKPKI